VSRRVASLPAATSSVRPITFNKFNTPDMMSNNPAIHEAAHRLDTELENADLLLLKSKPKFLSKKTHDDQEWPTSNDGPDALLPAALAANVEFQKASNTALSAPRASQNMSSSYPEVPAEPQVQVPRTSREEEVCR